MNECVDGDAVELSAGTAGNLGDRPVMVPRRSIGTVGCERIVSIRNSNNTRAKWDVFSRQLTGITAPIKPFVMMQQDQTCFFETFHAAQNHPAEFGMFLDVLELVFGKATLLEQDVIGHAYLADIV